MRSGYPPLEHVNKRTNRLLVRESEIEYSVAGKIIQHTR